MIPVVKQNLLQRRSQRPTKKPSRPLAFIRLKKNQRGIGLLELMLSLAIIAALLVAATRYYRTTHREQQVSEAVSMIEAIYAASESWKQDGGSFSGDMIDQFIDRDLLPKNFTPNPWGGDVTAVGDASVTNGALTISFTQVPTPSCNNLCEKVKHKMQIDDQGTSTDCGCSKDTFTIELEESQ